MTSARSQAEVIAVSDYNILIDKDPPRLEVIHWEDHFSQTGWNSYADAIEGGQRVYEVRSVGYIIYEDSKKIVSVPTMSAVNDHVADAMIILKACVISRKTIKE